MPTGEILLEHYREVLNHNNVNFELCVITNKDAKDGGILLVGMNPSGNGRKELFDYIEQCFEEEGKKDGFWNPKHRMMGKGDIKNNFDNKCGFIDLFPIRKGDQKAFEKNNDSNNQMMGQLLGVTQDYIETLHPRLIIFANTSDYYWGFTKEKDRLKLKPGEGFWMGYKFEPLPSPLKGRQEKDYWPFFKIIGIDPSGVNKFRRTTQLQNTYFLRYRQHEAHGQIVKPERELTPEDIRTIVNWINDPEWTAKLL